MMNLLRHGLALLAAFACLIAAPAAAVTFVEKNFAQLVGEAEQIFVGTVSSLGSRKLSSGAIVTDAVFRDLQVLKGATGDPLIVLLIVGGEVDGVRMEVPGVPQLRPGSRYLVFSKGNGKDMFPVVGGTAGIFRVAGNGIVVDSSDKPLPDSIATEIFRSGPGTPQAPVTLEVFLHAIRAKLALQ